MSSYFESIKVRKVGSSCYIDISFSNPTGINPTGINPNIIIKQLIQLILILHIVHQQL